MTKEQVVQLVGNQAVQDFKEDVLTLTTAPKPYAAFEAYSLVISPDKGVLKIVAVGKTIGTNGFGSELHDAFNEIRGAVTTTYGKPETYDYLKSGSIWGEPQEWMMGLLKKERTLVAYWTVKDTKPNHITYIALEAAALSTEAGWLRLGYEFEGFSEYLGAKKAKAQKVF